MRRAPSREQTEPLEAAVSQHPPVPRPGSAPAAPAAAGAGTAAGSRLDRWLGSYAERTATMTASEIRALFAVASRPEVVSLAGGMPYLPALPLDVVAEVSGRLVAQRGASVLQYGSGQGEPAMREQITEVVRPQGITAHPDDVVVTTGSQQALDLVARIFLDPGDVVLAEAPSYVGALGVFRSYQAHVEHVPMDDDGLQPAALEEALVRLRAAGRRVKLLYTVPNHHNPAGVTMSLQRRLEVLDVARRHGLLVLEDDPYALLGFDGDPLPALRSMDAEHVVHLGSFSKTFAPGYRVGWAVAPPAVREKLVLASESAVLCPTTLGQAVITEYLRTSDWYGQVKVFRELYRERRDAMLGALATHLPQASWTRPVGGFYVWLTLPEGLDARALLPRAVTGRVAFVPGTAFYADGRGGRHVRLSYCFPTPERIREGVRRLAGVVQDELEVLETFGPQSRPPGTGAVDAVAQGPELA
ncbi:aminotransferase-like domain-containing protein [Kineococcus esterisolvens]|uniref:aminotransferase-like domain-containing protein n=1 Tax=unclassified Kineococcus TaxID=2621656 RepID=UPI003D7C6B93